MHALAELILPALVTRGQAAELCGIAPNTFTRLVRLGTFPAPIPHSRKWSKAEVIRARDRVAGTLAAPDAECELEKWKRENGF